jgi:glycosyltransferase involved in cell wall biosynthesis
VIILLFKKLIPVWLKVPRIIENSHLRRPNMNGNNTRILFLIDSLNGGGKERRLVQLIKGLNERGFDDLHLISLSDVNDYPAILTYNVKLQIIKRKIKRDPGMFLKLFRQIKKINPDIVHSWSLMTSFYVSIICKMLGIPHVSAFVADCNPVKKFTLYHGAALFSYKFANVIVGNSLAGLNAYNVPPAKRKVIYNGFEMNRLKVPDTTGLKKDLNINTPFIVVMAARFDRMKDFETFFRAASQLLKTRKDITFLAIGKGDLFDDFELKIETENNNYIKMLGFRNDIDSITSIADIGVLCTNPAYHAEGISNALLEFMAFGKPVISTDGGGVKELITDGETGFIIDPQDPGELAMKINLLLNNPELLKSIGQNAKERVQTYFSLNKMTYNYIELYKNTVNQ